MARAKKSGRGRLRAAYATLALIGGLILGGFVYWSVIFWPEFPVAVGVVFGIVATIGLLTWSIGEIIDHRSGR